jgi:NAD dependent epimerase/dehydratase
VGVKLSLEIVDAERGIAGKRVLVTGAGGFIGSTLVERLVRAGASVKAMVHYNALDSWGNLDFITRDIMSGVEVISGNVEDGDFVARAAKRCDVIFHLAALIGIPYSYVAPRSYIRTNVEGTLNVLEAARRHEVARVVHTSTSEVYGTALRTPIDEDHPLQGQSPYSASKIGADKLAESYWLSFGTPIVTLRPFNTFGPRQSARAFIPTIISQAATADNEEIMLGALAPQRDMTFVSDTAAGFILAATSNRAPGETINLGVGKTSSVGEIADRILLLMGSKKRIVQDPARNRPEKSEVMRLMSDNRKAAEIIGWSPRTDFDEGLRHTISYVIEHLHLYRPNSYNL